MNKYEFFWNGPFSNWHPSEFKIEEQVFANAEQYMMWSKAVLMGDFESAESIMKTSNPRTCKALGRKIRPFNAQLWDEKKEQIVFLGCLEKFKQNPDLKEKLMATEGELVEASPYDSIWGIGLNEEDAKKVNPNSWPGLNLLGKVLTKVRKKLKK